MGHLVVQGVRPDGRVREGRRHGRVIHEAKLTHHDELAVPSHSEVRHTNTCVKGGNTSYKLYYNLHTPVVNAVRNMHMGNKLKIRARER